MDKKEIRDILLGRIVQLDENLWGAAPANTKFHFLGLGDGAGDVRLFGVTNLNRCYLVGGMEPDSLFEAAETALYSMGRPMRLESMPEKIGCLYAPKWISPVLLTFEREEDKLQMTAYTGRSLLSGWIRCRIALWIFGLRLPEGIVPNGKPRKSVEQKREKRKPMREKAKRAVPKKQKTAPKRLKK